MLVRNTSNRRMLPLRMELEVAACRAGSGAVAAGGRGASGEVPLPTQRRAVIELGPLRAVRGDVFGSDPPGRAVAGAPAGLRAPAHRAAASSLPGFVRDLEGEESTKRTASDLSFHTLREYVPGDDRRFIHWKSTARNGTLQVREFLQTHRSLVAVVLSGNPDDYRTVRPRAGGCGAESAGTVRRNSSSR